MSEDLSGAEEEVAFWRGAFERYKNDPSKSYIGVKLDPDRPLQGEIAERVRISVDGEQKIARILDVGCGPLSTVGKKADGLDVELVGLDPLADEYQMLIDEAGLKSPHTSVAGFAEKASEYFGEGSFDYVHAENSLDHVQDAERAVAELQKTCRPDAVFFFRVFVNEGEHNHYSGLHQWNFDSYNGKVIFWRPGQIHFLDEVFQLPVRFWYDDAVHGPHEKHRKFLNCEVHNTDLTKGFTDIGGMKVRYLPRFSNLVLQRNDSFDFDARCFAHFHFKDQPRHVESLVWPSSDKHHVLKVPEGELSRIVLGQFSKKVLPSGDQELTELWSGSVPLE